MHTIPYHQRWRFSAHRTNITSNWQVWPFLFSIHFIEIFIIFLQFFSIFPFFTISTKSVQSLFSNCFFLSLLSFLSSIHPFPTWIFVVEFLRVVGIPMVFRWYVGMMELNSTLTSQNLYHLVYCLLICLFMLWFLVYMQSSVLSIFSFFFFWWLFYHHHDHPYPLDRPLLKWKCLVQYECM